MSKHEKYFVKFRAHHIACMEIWWRVFYVTLLSLDI